MKRTIISSAVLALALAGTGIATADKPEGAGGGPVTKITGGGQTLVPTDGGAGDTVGFTAQVLADGTTRGQFQYVDRTGGTGQGQTVAHGTVTCATVFESVMGESGGVAVFGGLLRDGRPFRVDVTDSGQGRTGTDMILVQTGPAALDGSDDGTDTQNCDAEDEEAMDLNRGNVTIHKSKA